MVPTLYPFGEVRPEFSVPVLNERAVRASAGLLFFAAMVCFMNAWLVGNFFPTRVFVLAFFLDFSIRIFVSPRFSPSLIMGGWIVRHQQPEWTGAPQKRFAWGIGWMLAVSMLYLLVIRQTMGPINMLVCGLCLLLMFFETAFGICIGCKLYNALNKEQAQLCPGNVCAVPTHALPQTTLAQKMSVLAWVAMVVGLSQWSVLHAPVQPMVATGQALPAASPNPAEAQRCEVPAFAKAMGHEEKWKLHNGCQ